MSLYAIKIFNIYKDDIIMELYSVNNLQNFISHEKLGIGNSITRISDIIVKNMNVDEMVSIKDIRYTFYCLKNKNYSVIIVTSPIYSHDVAYHLLEIILNDFSTTSNGSYNDTLYSFLHNPIQKCTPEQKYSCNSMYENLMDFINRNNEYKLNITPKRKKKCIIL